MSTSAGDSLSRRRPCRRCGAPRRGQRLTAGHHRDELGDDPFGHRHVRRTARQVMLLPRTCRSAARLRSMARRFSSAEPSRPTTRSGGTFMLLLHPGVVIGASSGCPQGRHVVFSSLLHWFSFEREAPVYRVRVKASWVNAEFMKSRKCSHLPSRSVMMCANSDSQLYPVDVRKERWPQTARLSPSGMNSQRLHRQDLDVLADCGEELQRAGHAAVVAGVGNRVAAVVGDADLRIEQAHRGIATGRDGGVIALGVLDVEMFAHRAELQRQPDEAVVSRLAVTGHPAPRTDRSSGSGRGRR